MPKAIKIITTILIIYFVSCFFMVLNLYEYSMPVYYHYIQILYFTYIISLVIILLCSWRQKRSIIYFLFILIIITFNYIVILTNPVVTTVPSYELYNHFFLIFNGHDVYRYFTLTQQISIYVILPYYLLILGILFVLISYIIVNLKSNKNITLIFLKVFNIISIIFIIYFMSCFFILLYDCSHPRTYKFIPEMYLFYTVSLIVFLLFKRSYKQSIIYFLFILSFIIYNYIILIPTLVISTMPFFWLYTNSFLIYNGFYAWRYSNLIQLNNFYVIIPYILLFIGIIYVIVDYIIFKLKCKK